MEEQQEPRFAAVATIGTRFRTIAQSGMVTIAEGRLTLRRKKADVIAEGPVSAVWVEPSRLSFGIGTVVWVGDKRYAILPKSFNPGSAAGAVAKLARDKGRGDDLRELFMEAAQAEGRHRGRPPE